MTGSANATFNSQKLCEEEVVLSASSVLIKAKERHFDLLWSRSEEIDWIDFERRKADATAISRLADKASRLAIADREASNVCRD